MPTSPVLDLDALHRLEEELCDPDILCGFLHRFVAMLDQRIGRLERAKSTGDGAEWMDAVLSLRSSCALAGAQALAVHAEALQQAPAECRSEADSVGARGGLQAERMTYSRTLAAETARQLRIFLRQHGAGTSPPGQPPGTGAQSPGHILRVSSSVPDEDLRDP